MYLGVYRGALVSVARPSQAAAALRYSTPPVHSDHARECSGGCPALSALTLPHIQAYHSSYNEEPDVRQVGNLSVLPIKTKIRGPAPLGTSPDMSTKHLTPLMRMLSGPRRRGYHRRDP